jgi:parallel beta-helix repeat protein
MKGKAVSVMLILLSIGMLTLAFNIQLVKASGTIYIRANGSVDPPEAPIQRDGDVYTLTGNIYDPIVVERDNIVVDGAGYTVQGTASGTGIDLSYRSNVTIKNMEVKAFYYGIYLSDSSNNSIFGNSITNNYWYGICLYSSSNNLISGNDITYNGAGFGFHYSSENVLIGNKITNNRSYGIYFYFSSMNKLRNNHMSGNKNNFGACNGWDLLHFIHDIDSSNTVDGKPVYYWVNRHDAVVPVDAGYVALVNSTDITVQSLSLRNNGEGILLAYTKNSLITVNNIINNYHGIHLVGSSNNTISGNIVTYVAYAGVFPTDGICFYKSYDNMLIGNNICNAYCGFYLFLSYINRIHHNSFINNNPNQVLVSVGYTNVWDDGYPSGGNYWSDYTGTDANSDGIGDLPYVIDANNQDRYPLMNPWDTIPPVANAGPDQTVYEDTLVTFDASGSSDNIGITSYVWTFIDVTPQTLTGVNPTYTFQTPGIYTVTLEVSDAAGNHANDTVTITVLSLNPEELLQRLMETIEYWNLGRGTENSLTSKLEETILLLKKGNDNGAIHKLMDFINQVEALRDEKLTNEQADYLISEAQRIIDLIEG